MGRVLHKTADPVDYRVSVDTPKFDSADWFINPDISAVASVPTKYWARPLADPVQEMTQPQKDAVDAAEVAAAVAGRRAEAVAEVDEVEGSVGIRTRTLIEMINMQRNYFINRIDELTAALDAMKSSSGPADNIRAAIPASWLATNTQTKAERVQAYKDDINSGSQDS